LTTDNIKAKGADVVGWDKRYREAARQLGFQYLERDPFGLGQYPLQLFSEARESEDRPGYHRSAGQCSYVSRGRMSGVEVCICEYKYSWSTQGPGGTDTTNARYPCTLAGVTADCPPTSIGRERWYSGIGRALGARDIELGHAEFDRTFRLASVDEGFARALLTDDLVAWLLTAPKRVCFEIGGGAALSYSEREEHDPTELAQLVVQFTTLLSRSVLEGLAPARPPLWAGDPPGGDGGDVPGLAGEAGKSLKDIFRERARAKGGDQ
jgi:hypothetical protein